MRALLAFLLLTVQTLFVTAQPIFTSFEPISSPMIEWDQSNTTYYTGQTIQMNWTSVNFSSTDLARIQYVAPGGTRTLTTGSGAPIPAGSYSVRLSDNSNMVATNVPLTIAFSTNTAISLQSTTRISVIQSKLMNIDIQNNGASVTSGATLLCDNGNLTVVWRGLGQAQFGLASVSVKSGFGTTVGTALSNIPVSGNVTINYTLPRSFTPNGGSTYTAQISVQEPGQNAYTGTSVGFRLSAAPSTTPTSSSTPTPSKTPTPSNSPTPTPTPTISDTPSQTPTPSVTPTVSSTPTSSITPSPSVSSTPAPSLDLAALARNAASAVDTQTPAIAGALGGIGGILILMGGLKWYQNKLLTEKRKKKLAMTSKWVQEANSVYGIGSSSDPTEPQVQPSIVMYTVQNMPPKKQTKKAFTPVQGSSV